MKLIKNSLIVFTIFFFLILLFVIFTQTEMGLAYYLTYTLLAGAIGYLAIFLVYLTLRLLRRYKENGKFPRIEMIIVFLILVLPALWYYDWGSKWFIRIEENDVVRIVKEVKQDVTFDGIEHKWGKYIVYYHMPGCTKVSHMEVDDQTGEILNDIYEC
ncbi:hypothetical protein [Effusibacillus consociatus]|uniref:Uncharacterized protein n=1 Tax=Effusibacillus consociatus TaxID=1117041 RepID=A0ABV9Q7P8_9BACL